MQKKMSFEILRMNRRKTRLAKDVILMEIRTK